MFASDKLFRNWKEKLFTLLDNQWLYLWCGSVPFILIILQRNVFFWHVSWQSIRYVTRTQKISDSVLKTRGYEHICKCFITFLPSTIILHWVFDEKELVGKIETFVNTRLFFPHCCTRAQHCNESPQLKLNIYWVSLSFLRKRKYFQHETLYIQFLA